MDLEFGDNLSILVQPEHTTPNHVVFFDPHPLEHANIQQPSAYPDLLLHLLLKRNTHSIDMMDSVI